MLKPLVTAYVRRQQFEAQVLVAELKRALGEVTPAGGQPAPPTPTGQKPRWIPAHHFFKTTT